MTVLGQHWDFRSRKKLNTASGASGPTLIAGDFNETAYAGRRFLPQIILPLSLKVIMKVVGLNT